MSGPHPDGTGPFYPPPGYPAYPPPNHGPMPHPSNPGLMPMIQYKVRQKVGVRVHADTWVVGIVVGIVHLASMITGRKYQVQIESISGERETREFYQEDMVPYRPGG